MRKPREPTRTSRQLVAGSRKSLSILIANHGYDVCVPSYLVKPRVKADRSLVFDQPSHHGFVATTVRRVPLECTVSLNDQAVSEKSRCRGRASNIFLTVRRDVSSGASDEGLVEPADPAAEARQVGAFQKRVVEMDGVRVGIVGGEVVTGPRLRSARGQDPFSDLAWQPGDPICAPHRVGRRDRRGVGRTRPSENQEPGEPGYNSYHHVPLRKAPAGAVMMAVPSGARIAARIARAACGDGLFPLQPSARISALIPDNVRRGSLGELR
jgi:hypothetical protein